MVDAPMTPVTALGGISFPYSGTGAKAAAAAINADGGIDGHRVQIDICDNQVNPTRSEACGRQAKSNGDIAVVGSFDGAGAPVLVPLLQAEGIPYVGAVAATPVELSNPDSFIFDPGAVLAVYATSALFKDEGCKTVAVFTPAGQPEGEADLAAQQKVAATDGYKIVPVPVNITNADVSAPVSTALAAKPDCASWGFSAQETVKLLAGLRQAGYTGKFITAMAALLPQFLPVLGKAGNGVVVVNTTEAANSTDPLVTQFRNDLIAYTGGAKAAAADLNEFGQDGWSSVELIKQALTGTGSYTSQELLKKLPTMCDVNVGNVYPHVDLCKPAVSSTTYSRIYNTYERYYVAENGAYVPLDNQWHDIASDIPTS